MNNEEIYINDARLAEQIVNEVAQKHIPIYQWELEKLIELFIYHCPLNDTGFLQYCKKLRNLEFYNDPGEYASSQLDYLPELPNLERLYLKNTGIKDLSIISKFKNLTHLFIDEYLIIDISIINNLKKLKRLEIKGIGLKGSQFLKSINNIEYLSIKNIKLQGFPFFKFPSIKEVNLENVEIKDFPFHSFPKLKKLNLAV